MMTKFRGRGQFIDYFAKLFPEKHQVQELDMRSITRTVTIQVTDRCNLVCTYCYQKNKGTRRMTFKTGKELIDNLLSGDKDFIRYIDPSFTPAIVLEFIGGEPFLEVELIEQICEYFEYRAIELEHPWALYHLFNICTNGVNFFDPKVLKFIAKYKRRLSLSITLDGNKELHDSCRVFPDGSGSYDLAIRGVKYLMNQGYKVGSKITIAPDNLMHLFSATKHMVELGYKDIFANIVFEEGWKPEHNLLYYNQLTNISDYLLDNNLENDIYVSLFEEFLGQPMEEDNNANWCGGTGLMLAIDPDGDLYPCIRYMESSLGTNIKPLRIGSVDKGVMSTQEEVDNLKCLNCITRRSQSTDECFYCPVAQGCAWCSAYNYQVTGTPNKRVTYICGMHKTRTLANVYFWNKLYRKHNEPLRFKMYLPEQDAVEIVGIEEYKLLCDLESPQ